MIIVLRLKDWIPQQIQRKVFQQMLENRGNVRIGRIDDLWNERFNIDTGILLNVHSFSASLGKLLGFFQDRKGKRLVLTCFFDMIRSYKLRKQLRESPYCQTDKKLEEKFEELLKKQLEELLKEIEISNLAMPLLLDMPFVKVLHLQTLLRARIGQSIILSNNIKDIGQRFNV